MRRHNFSQYHKVVPPKRYKLDYKPHEYYRYITYKPKWNWSYLHQLNAIVAGGTTLQLLTLFQPKLLLLAFVLGEVADANAS